MKMKIFIATAILCSSNAVAQQGDTAKNLNEVVVTANKFPNKTSLTGKVLTIISREQIEQAGANSLTQLLSEQAGLYVNGANSNPAKDKSIYLRGAKVDHTLITIDGVPVYDPSGIGSNFDARLLSLDNIERIEILKGSQSTLYGSDAIAGVINIITRRAENKPYAVSGMLSYGNYNSFRGNAAISGKSKQLDYSLNYSYSKSGGMNEATDTITAPHQTDKDGFTEHNISAAVGFSLAKNIHLQPYFRYTHFIADIDQGAFTDELDFSTRLDNFQAGIKNEFHFGNTSLTINYNYNQVKRVYLDDSTLSRNGFDYYSKGVYKGSEHYAEAYVVHPFANWFRLTGGVDFRHSNSDQDYNSLSIYGPYHPLPLSKDSLKQQQLALYAALLFNHPDGFSAELGGRYNHHSVYGSNFVFNFNPSYLLAKQWKLFANISSGYKTPTLYQLFATDYGNRHLKPESSVNYEGGLQYFNKAGSFNARLVYFKRSVKVVIFFYTDPVSFRSYYINQDKQNDQGLEAELSLQLNKSISLKAFYTYVDGKITTLKGGKDTSYFNLLRRPRYSAGLSISGNFRKRLHITSSVQLTGNRTDIAYDAFFTPQEVKLKAYAIWNLYADYGFLKNKLKLFVNLNNITDTHYTEVYGFNAMGINGAMGIRFNF